MPLDTNLFSQKLNKIMKQLQVSINDVVTNTNLSSDRVRELLSGNYVPTGDEVLIISDYLKCDDYNYFISNDKDTTFEQSEVLYRKYGKDISKSDRWNIQEFLYLCDCESFLKTELKIEPKHKYSYIPKTSFEKQQGIDCAADLRKYLKLGYNKTIIDVFALFREFGINIFRRRLENSKISGVLFRNQRIGDCILINYSDDIYRQRFSLLHEIGHYLLDEKKNVINLSYYNEDKNNYSEVRANNFASRFIIPEELLLNIKKSNTQFTESSVIEYSKRLMVNPITLSYSLNEYDIINNDIDFKSFKNLKIATTDKNDPELPDNLSERIKDAKLKCLERGLTKYYINLCHQAYKEGVITKGRMAEMLFASENELQDLLNLFMLRI